jgi:hypothetical protein
MIARRSFVRRYRTELPQGWKAARVSPLWRVCEGSQYFCKFRKGLGNEK